MSKFWSNISLARLLPLTIGAMALVLGARVSDAVAALNGPVTGAALVPPAAAPVEKPPMTERSVDQASNLCNKDPACRGQPVTNAPPADDMGLVAAISERQHQLAAEAAALDDRRRAMDAASAALALREKQVSSNENALHQSVQQETALSTQDEAKLVQIYQAMKPAEAGAIFNVLDLRVGTQLLAAMDARHASAIMAAMLPQRAILATQVLVKAHQGHLDMTAKP